MALDLSTLTTDEQLAAIYIGYYDRAADPVGEDFWVGVAANMSLRDIATDFAGQQETLAEYPFLGDPTEDEAEGFIAEVYLNLFNRAPDQVGLDFWSDALIGAINGTNNLSVGEIILSIIGGAQDSDEGNDLTTIMNKIEVATAWTDAAEAAEIEYEFGSPEEQSAKDVIDLVDDTEASVTAALEKVAADFPVDTTGEPFTLTQRADNLTGTDLDDTFSAPVTQDETGSGAVSNTFETGDVLDGGEGFDVLNVDLTASLSGAVPIAPTISATTDSIEVVNLRAQFPNLVDTTIDAEKMSGVEQWWSDNSRSTITVEDIRSTPADTAFGMRETDPGISFLNFFNANYLEGGVEVGESAFNFTIAEDGALADEIANITVNGVRFELNGETYELDGDDVEAANTWAELETALQADIDATEGLEGLTVAHQGNGQFTVTDPNGGDFVIDPAGTVITSSTTNEVKAASLGAVDITDIPTETDIFLDNAGNGSQGGAMNVGVMSGDRGVEIFNVNVLDDSHLVNLASSNLRTGEQYLEEVYVEGEGSLFLGASTVGAGGAPAGVSTRTDDRLQNNGLVDVRVFDASGFEQELKVGAALTNNSISRYLDDAEEPVQFTYNLGDGGTNLSLSLTEDLTSDNDFLLEINGGALDDRINLSGDYLLDAVSIDGGEGRNTLEVSSDIGVDEDSTPAAFANIQKLVLAGTAGADADMEELAGVEELVVAFSSGSSSQIDNLEADTTVSISGKNQTLGNDSNDDQTIGTVTLEDAQSTTQAVDLDNTARNSGTLTVGAILVTESATGTSEVDELLLSSNGVRNTENVVQDIQADDASDVTFVGTQALSAHVSSLATDADQELTIDGSALEGDLTLAVNGALLVEDDDDVITGTEGEDDTLALYGGLDTNATVSGFETIQLGWLTGSDLADTFGTGTTDAEGLYDAANTSDAGTYVLGSLSGDIVLDNLSDGVNVIVGDDSAASGQQIGGFGQQITLSGSGSGTINVASVEELGSINFVGGAHDLMIDNFADVNLDYVRPDDAFGLSTLNSGLQLDGIDLTTGALSGLDGPGGAAVFADGYEVDNVVRNLTITGGDAEEDDALVLNDVLPASLAVIDVSGYEGAFTATLANAVIEDPNTPGDYLSVNTDTRFVLNDEDVDITLTDLAGPSDADTVDFNAIFEFTAAPAAQVGGAPAVTWTIDNFVGAGGSFSNADNNNYSILDLSDLGIESFADLDITNDGTDVSIVEEGGGSTWEIVLTGVQVADLAQADNFIFA